jgi:hypothetical protein
MWVACYEAQVLCARLRKLRNELGNEVARSLVLRVATSSTRLQSESQREGQAFA